MGLRRILGLLRRLSLPALLVAGAFLLLVFIALLGKEATAPEVHKKIQPSQHEPKPKPAPRPAYTFPGGGTKLFPGYRLVALYGSPNSSRLGVLGERPVEQSLQLAKDIAAQYQPFTKERVLPTFEIITTIASADPTENGDYSRELSQDTIRPWVEAAKDAGVYVVLDLQPGRTDFLSQAKLYEELLKYPNVGLALDPEWRLKPDQMHLKQIGSVDAAEVNATAQWLAELVKREDLPQKLFLLHQFRLSMIANRAALDASHPELGYVIQMDGNGAQSTKNDTWLNVIADPPANVQFGWKNFYDEDRPVLSPEQTMLVQPQPWYVSYQ
jgi:hypothetical protein